jgi:hypothetical protein
MPDMRTPACGRRHADAGMWTRPRSMLANRAGVAACIYHPIHIYGACHLVPHPPPAPPSINIYRSLSLSLSLSFSLSLSLSLARSLRSDALSTTSDSRCSVRQGSKLRRGRRASPPAPWRRRCGPAAYRARPERTFCTATFTRGGISEPSMNRADTAHRLKATLLLCDS